MEERMIVMNSVENKEVSIIIGADVLPTPNNYDLFSQGRVEELLGKDLWTVMEKADFRVFNLEGPLTNEKHPILKDGPVLSAPESTIAGLAAMKTDLLALSNNHIRDHGAYGIQRTIALAKDNKIAYIGVGVDQKERSGVYIFQQNGFRIGFYNCCENEESVVPEGEYGANPYDPLDSFDDVQAAKQECDFLIVLYHGGKELFRYPSPLNMRRFRKFADKGADIVIAQHTHCVGSYENYKGSLLLYGQGNFIFNRSDNEYYNNGLLLKVTFEQTKSKGYRYDFIPIQRKMNVVRLADREIGHQILTSMEERSRKLQDENFIQKEYMERADEYVSGYLFNMHGHLWLMKVINKVFKGKLSKYFIRYLYSNKAIARIKNYIACEAHHELLLTGVSHMISKRED